VNDDLDILLTRYFDGSASGDEVASLERLLVSEPDAAHALLSAARQELALRDAHGLGPATGVASPRVEVIGESRAVVQARPTSPLAGIVVPETDDDRSRWRIDSWRSLAVAASLLLVVGLVWYTARPGHTGPVAVHPKPPEAAGALATVEPAGPGVTIERNGVATPIEGNAALAPNDHLHTGAHGATFSYPAEKTRVTLGASSVLGIANDQGGKKLDLVSGAVDCEVEKQQPGRGLAVVTPQARVEVKGTRFRVITAGHMTRVEVGHGTVRVTRLVDGATVDVSQGEYVDVGAAATTRPTAVPGWPVAHGRNMAEFWSPQVRPAGINE